MYDEIVFCAARTGVVTGKTEWPHSSPCVSSIKGVTGRRGESSLYHDRLAAQPTKVRSMVACKHTVGSSFLSDAAFV